MAEAQIPTGPEVIPEPRRANIRSLAQETGDEGSRKVGLLLGMGIALLPGLFVWFLLRKGYSTKARVVGFGWAALLLVLSTTLSGGAPTPAPQSAAPSSSQLVSATGTDPAGGRTCLATDNVTDTDIGIGEDGSTLRVAPDNKAKYVMQKLGDGEMPHSVAKGRTLIREECRSGRWSRVRIVAPADYRDVAGWVPSTELARIKTSNDRRRVYQVSDFDWNPGNTGNHSAVVAALNTVIRQNPSCDAYDTSALIVSDTSSNPSVDALCLGPKGPQHLNFTLAEVRAGKIVTAAGEAPQSSEVTTTLSSSDAYPICKEATLDKLNHPSTADFSIFDTTLDHTGNESRFTMGLTAKNGFGLELHMISTCVFEGNRLTLNWVEEGR